jgi:hypothetical protein
MSGLLLGAALLAAGCAKKGAEDETVNAAENVAQGVTVPLSETPPQPAIAEVNNSADAPALAAEEPLSDEEQMQEDAAATGMTSRLPAEVQESTGTEPAPAE